MSEPVGHHDPFNCVVRTDGQLGLRYSRLPGGTVKVEKVKIIDDGAEIPDLWGDWLTELMTQYTHLLA